jgi:hypothetical protein
VWEALLAITGSLLFGCASEPSTGELYFKDDAGHVHQLTVTEPKQGAWDAGWQGDRYVAVIDRGFRNGLERRSLATPPAEVGRRRGRRVSTAAVSAQRRVAYAFGRRGGRRFAVMRLDGSRRRVFRRDWIPQTWSPNGRRILVGNRSRVGLMNASTGTVRRLGTLPCGYLTSAVWTRTGEHPWPAPR